MHTYSTTNLYLAAFLWLRGLRVEVAPTPGERRVTFVFPEEAREAAAEYTSGALVDVAAYADFLARLKSRVVAVHNTHKHTTTHARVVHHGHDTESAAQ
jgi:flavin reductase (DIM6/NTAB) family NADH-FMN oxidoreductase RutF